MLYDFDKIDFDPAGKVYDVCVCGTGAAGTTVALALVDQGKRVALLEGGGLEYSDESMKIYGANSTGRTYYGANSCRLRWLGGTTNHWTGMCKTLQTIDFEQRDYFELPGWPIAKSELDRYLAPALKILDIDIPPSEVLNRPIWKDSSLTTIWTAMSSPVTRFGVKYRDQLKRSDNIDLFVNANVTDLRLNENRDNVDKVVVKGFKGKSAVFSGRQVVIAFGAVENARFLLNCDSQVAKGIGNHSDYVGRCFMEHLGVDLGRFVADLSNPIWKTGRLSLYPEPAFAHREKIGTGVVAMRVGAPAPLYGRLKVLKEFVRDNVCLSQGLTELSRKMVHFNCPGDGLITSLIEQEPNRSSRITLNGERDALGMRRIDIDWRLTDFDKRTIRTLAMEAAREMARTDTGRVQLPAYLVEENGEYEVSSHCHQMGTTRMAEQSKDGVVDQNCKVFNVDNLYMAGSSVFSTGGGVNPTLPIVQLALRLADHLGR